MTVPILRLDQKLEHEQMPQCTISENLEQALAVIESFRRGGVHLHCIANSVAQNFTANVLLACGAGVSMTTNPNEISGFVENADALHINLGTLDDERLRAIPLAVDQATTLGKPMSMDPVKVHRSKERLDLACDLAGRVDLVRGNRDEIRALTDSLRDDCCVIATDEKDLVRYKGDSVTVTNGDEMLTRVIATGCAHGALVSALLPVAQSPFVAGLAGTLWFAIAGEVASGRSSGPGSFAVEFLDALYQLDAATITQRARLS